MAPVTVEILLIALLSTIISCVVSFRYTDYKLKQWREEDLATVIPKNIRSENLRKVELAPH